MLALRRLAAAQAHETWPLAAALVNSAQLPGAQHHSLQPASSPSGVTTSLHSRSSSSSRSTQHQRRHSSSKPSSPPSDDAIASTSAAAPAGKESGSTGTRKRERAGRVSRAKEGDGEKRAAGAGGGSTVQKQTRELPSVPATEHLDSQAVNLASFFSLHRPISVTSPVPSASNAQAFAALFQPSFSSSSPSPRRVNETLLSLASAVRVFDKAINQHQHQQNENQEINDLRHAVTQASTSNAENEDVGTIVFVNVQDLAQDMRPFHPPPPPQPMPQYSSESIRQLDSDPVGNAKQADQTVRELRQSTLLAALRGRLAEKHRNRQNAFSFRMKTRRRSYLARSLKASSAQTASVYHAISVRRQRKLKMKKHKFKKLLKRQKNEKRKQDRL